MMRQILTAAVAASLVLAMAPSIAVADAGWTLPCAGCNALYSDGSITVVMDNRSTRAYNTTSTQGVALWTVGQLCQPAVEHEAYPMYMRLVGAQLLAYACGDSNYPYYVHTLNVSTGQDTSRTRLNVNETFPGASSGAVWGPFPYWSTIGQQTLSDVSSGLYCTQSLPVFCRFGDGRVEMILADDEPMQTLVYRSGSTLVVRGTKTLSFVEAATGVPLKGSLERPDGDVLPLDKRLLIVDQQVNHTKLVVIDTEFGNVTARAQLLNWTASDAPSTTVQADLFTAPMVQMATATTALVSRVQAGRNGTLAVWTVSLVAPDSVAYPSHHVELFDTKVQQTGCVAALEQYVACMAFTSGSAAPLVIVDATAGVVASPAESNSTMPSIDLLQEVRGTLVAGASTTNGWWWGGVESRPEVSYTAAYQAGTGALLWEGPFEVVGPQVAFDPVNSCVVTQRVSDDAIVCIGSAGP